MQKKMNCLMPATSQKVWKRWHSYLPMTSEQGSILLLTMSLPPMLVVKENWKQPYNGPAKAWSYQQRSAQDSACYKQGLESDPESRPLQLNRDHYTLLGPYHICREETAERPDSWSKGGMERRAGGKGNNLPWSPTSRAPTALMEFAHAQRDLSVLTTCHFLRWIWNDFHTTRLVIERWPSSPLRSGNDGIENYSF